MYSHLIVFLVNIASCYCYVGYEMFQGFDMTEPVLNTTIADIPKPNTTIDIKYLGDTTLHIDVQTEMSLTTELDEPATTFKSAKFMCPEEERPSNIGPYEVPTQRDFVLLTRDTLTRMFNSYHQKALLFLKDIQEATRATVAIEKKCHGKSKMSYRRCVKDLSNRCEVITKSLVTSLEKQRQDVSAFTGENICDMTAMKADPVQLIKILAMEDASLEFALPGFLRLLGACSSYCHKSSETENNFKPVRHMTDQDLVVRHFLTKQNYIQLIKNST